MTDPRDVALRLAGVDECCGDCDHWHALSLLVNREGGFCDEVPSYKGFRYADNDMRCTSFLPKCAGETRV